MVKSRRKQQDRRAATRAALLDAARRQFGAAGYEATLLDGIAADVGVTKGAVYHHFPDGKPQLFEAVVLLEQEAMLEAISSRHSEIDDGFTALGQRLRAYFVYASQPGPYRITLHDAPVVLGFARWREVEYRYTTRLIEAELSGLIERGAIPRLPAAMIAAAIYGACEAVTHIVAAADDRPGATEEAVVTIVSLFRGLSLAEDRRRSH